MCIELVVKRDCWWSKVMDFVVDLANLESLVVRTEVRRTREVESANQAHGRDKGHALTD